ncbi:MAG: ATP-binding protein [Proteobacteria bacterium]|nr:ATP-binding protein [Pseudomonadota bacterium]
MGFKLSIYFFLIYTSINFAQENTDIPLTYIPATNITTRDGLTNNNVNKITQDTDGFVWIATDNGLNRYDAHAFKHLTKDKNNHFSIPGKQIESIIQVSQDELWLSIFDVGLVVFNLKTKQFTHIKNSDSLKFKLPKNNFFDVAKDHSGNVWLPLFGKGMYEWDINSKKYINHIESSASAWFTSTKPYDIFIDSKNMLWISTIDAKVFRYSIDSKESEVYLFDKPIYDLIESNQGTIYAGGYEGVFEFDSENNEFQVFIDQSIFAQHYGERASIALMLWDSKDNLWIASTSSILLFQQGQLKSVRFYQNGEELKSDWWARDIFEDNEGGIWFGTSAHGIFKLSPSWNKFNTLIANENMPINYINTNEYQSKLYTINRAQEFKEISFNNGSIDINQITKFDIKDAIFSIYQYEPDTLWLVKDKGIDAYSLLTKEYTHVTQSMGNSHLEKVDLKLFYHKNKIYYSLYGDTSFGYIDTNTKIAYTIEPQFSRLQGTKFYGGQMINNEIWMRTNFGIESYDLEKNAFKVIQANSQVWDISSFKYVDQDNIYVVANSTLFKFKYINGKLVKVNNQLQDLFPRLELTQISLFDGDVMWIRTLNQGVVKLNLKSNEYDVFTEKDGLPSNSIIGHYNIANQNIIVANAGISVIQKQAIKEEIKEKRKPNLIIDKVVHNAEIIDVYNSPQTLTLNNNYGILTFDIVLLDFAANNTFEYEYKLMGSNDDWIHTTSNSFSFLNVNPGSYTFRVKGRSNYGQWSNEALYSFKVKSPPWQTIWAYLLYALLAVSMIAWIFYLYKRKLLYEHKIVKEKTQKQLAKQASKAKSDFLARVSHEVRTPLNGVLGMSELLQDTSLDEEQKVYTDTIIASGNHLLDIINDILDLSKIESGKLELELHSFDLLLLIDEIIGSFTSQAKHKQLLFTCQFEHSINRNRIGDVIRIKQILFNLLSNAFKFTKHGEITLNISQSKTLANGINILVADTGIGINNKAIEDLFKPFVQADSATTRKYGGTGLGLAIVKQLVNKMQGTITAQSKSHSGSLFSIELPLEIGTGQLPKKAILKNIHVGMSIQQPNLKQSLIEYCKLLAVNINNDINTNSQCIFIDTFKELSPQQVQQIKIAKSLQVQVVYIGFNCHNLPKDLCQSLTAKQLISPPITFKKLYNICNNSIEEQTLKTLPGFQVATLSLKILVVEDNTINQQVSIEMLERMGHVVDVVDTAEEALVMLYRNNYDLLLSDYHLPGMDGIDLIKNWNNPKAIPIIMVTADLTDKVLQACSNLKINNIVAKPFTQQTLFTAIEKALATYG